MVQPRTVTPIAANVYVLPQFEVVSLPSALPRDQLQYGVEGTRAGLAVHGTPFYSWSYLAHVVIVPAGTSTVALLGPTNSPVTKVTIATQTKTELDLEDISISFKPNAWSLTKLGIFRIPFSLAQMTEIPEQMFPFRASQTPPFQDGSDVGLLTRFTPLDGRIQLNLGVFLGTSLGFIAPGETVEGPVLAGSFEIHPLGAIPHVEGDFDRGPFRFALGASALGRIATAYNSTGYEATRFIDVRLDASVRVAWKGFFLQGEYLRHLATNDFTARPEVDEAVYAEASLYLPIGKVGIGPLGRIGQSIFDEQFAPQTFTSFEAGLVFFPRADLAEPERFRVIAEYLNASVAPIKQMENEGLLQLQMAW